MSEDAKVVLIFLLIIIGVFWALIQACRGDISND
jgi:hypothetical protein